MKVNCHLYAPTALLHWRKPLEFYALERKFDSPPRALLEVVEKTKIPPCLKSNPCHSALLGHLAYVSELPRFLGPYLKGSFHSAMIL
jgi:hypothetical protein